jgi:hypothetical protein
VTDDGMEIARRKKAWRLKRKSEEGSFDEHVSSATRAYRSGLLKIDVVGPCLSYE